MPLRTGMFFAFALLAELGAGCARQSVDMSGLPDPQLDLMYRHAMSGAPRPAPAPVPIQPLNEWTPLSGQRSWKYIVIHHSATARGNADEFNKMHLAKGWDGLGYHFVIDNGNGGPDGRVEVGPRWRVQKWGAHAGGTPDNAYNNYGIGVCLVGDFTDHLPSESQLASLNRLVRYLMQTYNIPAGRVIGHREAPNAKTECPGRMFSSYLTSTFRPSLAR